MNDFGLWKDIIICVLDVVAIIYLLYDGKRKKQERRLI